MHNKTVFVLLDGLQSNYAKEHLGYLEHLCQKNQAAKYEVLGELPSASRPMYETIFTGLPVYKHGITNNGICRLSKANHLFKLLKQNNKKSLALAYYWISELYYLLHLIILKIFIITIVHLILIKAFFTMKIVILIIIYMLWQLI